MQSFGKTIRNAVPAFGLGLIAAFGAVSVAVAPAAMAQGPVTAKKEFVDNVTAASDALAKRQWATVIQKADAAWPHAANTSQKSTIEQLRVAATCDPSLKNHAACISAIEKAKATGGLPGSIVKNYDEMLAGRYSDSGQNAKALSQTKDNIAKYGGKQNEFAFVARKELEAKNYAEAIKWANRAIGAGKASHHHYNILLNAYAGQNNMDEFYKVLERIAPIMNQETYWRMLIDRTKKEKNYRSIDSLLDIYRAMQAAGVKLKPEEVFEMGDSARKRGFAIEAEKVFAPAFQAGTLGGASDKNAVRSKELFAQVKKDAATDKATGLAKTATDAATAPDGQLYARAGENYLGAGEYAKAIELFQKSLAKGQMDAGMVDLIKVRLGIAQLRAGKKADAVKTWQSVKADNGAAWLAKSWIAISKS